jgi:hypothetical protein
MERTTVKKLAHDWASSFEDLSEYRIDAAEDGFMAGYYAALAAAKGAKGAQPSEREAILEEIRQDPSALFFGMPLSEVMELVAAKSNKRVHELIAAVPDEQSKPFCFYNSDEDAIYVDGARFVKADEQRALRAAAEAALPLLDALKPFSTDQTIADNLRSALAAPTAGKGHDMHDGVPHDFKGRFLVSGMFDYAEGSKRISMPLWDVRLESLEHASAGKGDEDGKHGM